MTIKKSLYTAVGIAAIAFTQSCKSLQPAQLPAVKNMPDHFVANSTGESMAKINWRQFFTDKNLVTLIDSSLKYNPDLLIAAQRIEMARAQLSMSKGAFLPSVNAVASAAGDRYGDYTMNGVGNFDTNLSSNIDDKQKIPAPFTPDFFLGLRSSWEIDIWGKLKNQKKAATARMAASIEGRQLLITLLVAEVSELYYELLALDNELQILQKNISLQESALEIVKVQKEGGRATELAIQQFRAQLLNTQELQYTVKQKIVSTENALNTIAGRYPTTILRDTALMRQQLPANINAGLPTALLAQRPDIKMAEFELQAAKADVAAARAAFYPSLTLTPYAGINAFKAGLLFNGSSFVYGGLAGLTAPLFNQNKLKAGYAIVNAQNKEAVYNYQKILLRSYSEVVTQLSSIENNRIAYQLKQQEVTELSNAVATSKDLYVTGYATYLEVITAQKGVLEAELQLSTNKKESFQALIQLYRSLGGGWN
ncbi:MAG: TolC family protein [Chitinophagaceae bacterium]